MISPDVRQDTDVLIHSVSQYSFSEQPGGVSHQRREAADAFDETWKMLLRSASDIDSGELNRPELNYALITCPVV